MVAKITFPHNVKKALNYNEQKVQKSKAECIHAGNFLQDKNDLNFHDKLNRFKDVMALNTRATTNTLHISLNFDPSEKLSQNELTTIASSYMTKIGFGERPYLVYEHLDAGHPHIHIVTTNIRDDGSRINTHNIGRNQSEKARKEIESEFGLIKASERNNRLMQGIEPVNVQKIIYGKSETKRSITNILDAVINQYKYTSLAELNAVLKQYNVVADRGHEEGRIYKNMGLVYRVLDEQGNKVGVPIKASSIYSKPTLASLEKKFEENEEKRKPHRQSIKEKIDQELEKTGSLQQFIRELRKKGLATILRQNDKDTIYGITFIDYNSKSVFNGSDLGKQYSASSLQQQIVRSGNIEIIPVKIHHSQPESSDKQYGQKEDKETVPIKEREIDNSVEIKSTKDDLLQQMLNPEKNYSNIPLELKKRKKKKKKRKFGF